MKVKDPFTHIAFNKPILGVNTYQLFSLVALARANRPSYDLSTPSINPPAPEEA